ncbi:hypothetical protein Ciccas_013359 [Cichlidogyrus casuarinus]|uniref:Uncharacterized protein n=1 Tax=Cichlidogyrus casuarinus TaxID=1844966 RepID=A0ABD2PKU4_9PLAT
MYNFGGVIRWEFVQIQERCYQAKSTAELLELKTEYEEELAAREAASLDDLFEDMDCGQGAFGLLSDLDSIDKDSLLPLC